MYNMGEMVLFKCQVQERGFSLPNDTHWACNWNETEQSSLLLHRQVLWWFVTLEKNQELTNLMYISVLE